MEGDLVGEVFNTMRLDHLIGISLLIFTLQVSILIFTWKVIKEILKRNKQS